MKNFNIYQNKERREKVEQFRKNKNNLSLDDLNEVKLYLNQYKDLISSTQFFSGTVKDCKVVSCIANNFYEEVLDYIQKKFNPDFTIIAVPPERVVILKKNESGCTVNLCNFAKILCNVECDDSHGSMLFGDITENFINFTKKLSACTI